jgi:hypothetical protein
MIPDTALSSMDDDGMAAGNNGANTTVDSLHVRIDTPENHHQQQQQPNNDLTAGNVNLATVVACNNNNSCSSPVSSHYAPSSSLSLESFDDESRLARAIAAATASAQELVVPAAVQPAVSMMLPLPVAGMPTTTAATATATASDAAAPLPPSTTSWNRTEVETAAPTSTTSPKSGSGSGGTTAVEVSCCCGVMGRPTLSTTGTTGGNDDDHDVWKTSSPNNNNHTSAAAASGHGPSELAIRTTRTEEEDDDDFDDIGASSSRDDEDHGDCLDAQKTTHNMLQRNAATTPKRGNQSQSLTTTTSSSSSSYHQATDPQFSTNVLVPQTTAVPPPTAQVSAVTPGNVDPHTLISMLTASFEEDTSPGGVELVMTTTTTTTAATAAAAAPPLPKASTTAANALDVVDTVPPLPPPPPPTSSLPASSCASSSSMTGPLEYGTPLDDDDDADALPLDTDAEPTLDDTTTKLDTLGARIITDEPTTTSRTTEPTADLTDSTPHVVSLDTVDVGEASPFLAATLSTIQEGVGSDTMGPTVLASSTTTASSSGSVNDLAPLPTTMFLLLPAVDRTGVDPAAAVEQEAPVSGAGDKNAPLDVPTTGSTTLENPKFDVSGAPLACGGCANMPAAAATLESTPSELSVQASPSTTSDSATESHLEPSIDVTRASASFQTFACTEASGTAESNDEREQTATVDDARRPLNDPSASAHLPTNEVMAVNELVSSDKAADLAKGIEQASLELTT